MATGSALLIVVTLVIAFAADRLTGPSALGEHQTAGVAGTEGASPFSTPLPEVVAPAVAPLAERTPSFTAPAVGVTGVARSQAAESATESEDSEPASVPIVFSDFVPGSIGQDPAKVKILEQLRESFIAEVGSYNGTPSDPEYFERWQKAQESNDQRYQAMFGTDAFNEQQALAIQHK